MEGINYQRVEKRFKSDFEVAKRYYTIILGLNDLHVTKSELNLVAFSAVNDTISALEAKHRFCKTFQVPAGSIYNMICKLRKLQIFIKDPKDRKIRINPLIRPDFSKRAEMVLVLKIAKDATD